LTDSVEPQPIDLGGSRTLAECRIDEILDLMVSGKWKTGATHRELAARWNLSISRVEELATEGNRVLRRLVRADGSKETLLARTLCTIDALGEVALNRTRIRVVRGRNGAEPTRALEPDPDVRSALEALKLKAALLGLYAPMTATPWHDDPERLAEVRLLRRRKGENEDQ
jgi:hypothetical protein